MGETWKDLWKNYQDINSVTIINEPGGMLLRSEFIGILLKYFDLRNKSVLDVGTGTGQYCIELALRGAECTGIDKDPGSIDLANRIANDYQIKNCIFEEKDLYDFDKPGFDIVISMGVLEHLNDSEIINMLKKMKSLGKYIIIGVPYSDSDIYKLSKLYSQKKGTWEYGFERDFLTLSGLFKEAGLSIFHEQVIGLGSESYCLKRINPELIPLQLSQNLARSFNGDNNVGNWLIAIGSERKKHDHFRLEERIPEESVSIIIPIYNGEKYIKKSINNLKKIYYPNLEVIYVNDGSTDNTKMLLGKSPFSILNLKENVGVSEARLEGLEKAKNDYIFFLDIDDLVFPECITKIMRDLKNCPHDTHLSVSCALMDKGEYTGGIWFHKLFPSIHDHILSEIFALCGKISLQNTIIKKGSLLEAYKKINVLIKKVGIDRIRIAEDTLLLDIMVFSGLIKHIIPVYYTYRGYEQSPTSASRQIGDRINDIPIQTAYCFTEIRKISKVNEKELENRIIYQAIKSYGVPQGTEFVNNFKKYKDLI